MWVVMIQHKTSDQYLTSGKVSTRSIHGFKRYRLLKTLTKNFNILCNADVDADVNADAVVTAIALPVLSYRRAKKRKKKWNVLLTTCQRTSVNVLTSGIKSLMACNR